MSRMKKSGVVALLMGTASGLLFMLGMCMALIAEWNAFVPGIVCGAAGAILAVVTVIVWRRMEHKPKITLTKKVVLAIVVAVIGAVVLGVGLCLCLAWSHMLPGIIVGCVGILFLVGLIPVLRGVE